MARIRWLTVMERSKYPERFWHCNVTTIEFEAKGKTKEREAFAVDLSIQQIDEQIVTPWIRNANFVVDGLIVRGRDAAKEIKIIHTEQNSHFYYAQEQAEARRYRIVDVGASPRYSPFAQDRKTEYTHEFLFASLSQQITNNDRPGTIRIEATVARSFVRKLLKYVLKTPSEFDAFCLDYFPRIHQQFSNGMDTTEKMNRLLIEDLERIYNLLKQEYPTAVEEYENRP